ncbi:MAG: iron chaperone [Actinomycetota bacterium]
MADDDKLSDVEREAVKQRAAELKKQGSRKGGAKKERDRQDVLDTIEGLEGSDKEIAQMLHEIVSEIAPDLDPKTFYGFPAYARDGKVVVFFQQASKFGTRYGTVSFDESANLDDGAMWPTSFAVTDASDAVRQRVAELVQKAIS